MVRVLLRRESDILTAEIAEKRKGIMFEKYVEKKQITLSAFLCVLGGNCGVLLRIVSNNLTAEGAETAEKMKRNLFAFLCVLGG